jgi:hypothetical protein
VRDHDFYAKEKGKEAVHIPNAPVGEWRSITLDAAGGFWATDLNLVVHFDGEQWRFIGDVPGGNGVVGAATDGTDLYLVTSSQFLRASHTEVTTIVEDYSLNFTAITASTAGEIFVAVRDGATKDDQCSGDFIAHWDGAEFHVF